MAYSENRARSRPRAVRGPAGTAPAGRPVRGSSGPPSGGPAAAGMLSVSVIKPPRAIPRLRAPYFLTLVPHIFPFSSFRFDWLMTRPESLMVAGTTALPALMSNTARTDSLHSK